MRDVDGEDVVVNLGEVVLVQKSEVVHEGVYSKREISKIYFILISMVNFKGI